jgi:hypothetical protein
MCCLPKWLIVICSRDVFYMTAECVNPNECYEDFWKPLWPSIIPRDKIHHPFAHKEDCLDDIWSPCAYIRLKMYQEQGHYYQVKHMAEKYRDTNNLGCEQERR